MDYYCKLCDKSAKIKSKKKHLNSQLHKDLNKQVTNRYRVENPDFIQIETISKIMFVIIIKNSTFMRLYVNGNYIFQIWLLLLNRIHGSIIQMVVI